MKPVYEFTEEKVIIENGTCVHTDTTMCIIGKKMAISRITKFYENVRQSPRVVVETIVVEYKSEQSTKAIYECNGEKVIIENGTCVHTDTTMCTVGKKVNVTMLKKCGWRKVTSQMLHYAYGCTSHD